MLRWRACSASACRSKCGERASLPHFPLPSARAAAAFAASLAWRGCAGRGLPVCELLEHLVVDEDDFARDRLRRPLQHAGGGDYLVLRRALVILGEGAGEELVEDGQRPGV